MSLLVEIGCWIAPQVEQTLFGPVLHLGWISVGILRGRLTTHFYAWRHKVQQAVRR